ncbi:DUF6476 family protein [Sinisalibacter lacisalsi]|uniref:Uncharacterized protein n=1 Tax=Sinisalibacter lacisalsi TaxID=1526570 RepID=A0ABQ1QQD3_9RHOB|nr:DUF6476 family protein [Sinisalibacter lacisalsi]GGD40858.1 hypothetical protein GCM10011358_25930 [Sinisalibacter lacisalsi]
MDEAPIPEGQAPLVRYLKWLVTTLTVTMIAGFIVLVSVVVMRFNAAGTVPLPETIALPAGTEASAITRGPDWLGVVTTDGRILIYGLDGTTLRQEITVAPAE